MVAERQDRQVFSQKMCDLCDDQPPTQDDKNRVTQIDREPSD